VGTSKKDNFKNEVWAEETVVREVPRFGLTRQPKGKATERKASASKNEGKSVSYVDVTGGLEPTSKKGKSAMIRKEEVCIGVCL